MNTRRALIIFCALAGCTPAETDLLPGGDVQGRPFDVQQHRVRSFEGDSFDRHMAGLLPPLQHKPRPDAEKDWNYNIGTAITSGVALYNNAYAGGTLTASCTDKLFVATTANGSNNLWAFDRLYQANPACVSGGSDGGRCASAYCPHRIWNISLSGTIDRSSVTLSLDGSAVYVATSTGVLYSVNPSSGAINWSFDARLDLGAASNAGFAGSAPWVNYNDGSMYIGATYTSGGSSRIRLYKVSSAGAKLYSLDLGSAGTPEGIVSSVIAFDAVYFGTTGGRVYRIADSGAAFTAPAAPWPVQLSAEKNQGGTATADVGQPIDATPTIDVLTNTLFVPVNNVMWSVNLATGARSGQGFGWTNANQAQQTDVPCFSSPWADLDNRKLFVGHGRFSGGNSQNRIFGLSYNSNGTMVAGGVVSTAVRGTAGTISLQDPKSSPIFLATTAPRGNVFIGDAGGFIDKWAWNGAGFNGRTTFTSGAGIAGPVIIDFLSGNLYFGNDAGHIFQITQANLN